MSPEPVAPLVLAELFRDLMRDKNQQEYIRRVSAWYSQETIQHVLAEGDTDARRGAVVMLGHTADYRCNASLGHALHDPDMTVRRFAADALWAVWFRAGTPEQNEQLLRVVELRESSALAAAVDLASDLIAEAPTFAEAYNQRAYALFQAGKYEPAIDDCRRTLELNPYHFGAATGLGNCFWHLGQRDEALQAFRQALEINPSSPVLKDNLRMLQRLAH